MRLATAALWILRGVVVVVVLLLLLLLVLLEDYVTVACVLLRE